MEKQFIYSKRLKSLINLSYVRKIERMNKQITLYYASGHDTLVFENEKDSEEEMSILKHMLSFHTLNEL